MRRTTGKETPEERFKRIAEARTNAVLERLRVLGNLSNRQVYRYSEEEVNRIFSTINKRLKEVKAKFDSRKTEKFKL